MRVGRVYDSLPGRARYKTYRGYDLATQTTMCWRVYTETDLY
jgi:hypothetical protein